MASRVLLVVADEDARTFLHRLLEQRGFEVLPEPRADRALGRIKGEQVDCVVEDVMPGRERAFALLYAVREHRDDEVASVAFVVSSGRDRSVDRLRAWEGGCDAYLARPHHIDELVGAIRETVSRSPKERVRRRQEAFDEERRRIAEERAGRS